MLSLLEGAAQASSMAPIDSLLCNIQFLIFKIDILFRYLDGI